MRVILWRSKNRQSVPIPTRMPLSASLALIPARVMSGVSATNPRITCECASIRFERRSPPCVRGSIVPVVLICCCQRQCQPNANQTAKCAKQIASGCQLTPLGQGGRAVLFEDIAAVEVAVVVEVVVD